METLQRTANRGSISTGYDIDNSLKIEADYAERIQRVYSGQSGSISSRTPTSTKIATISFWIKRTELQPSGNHLCFLADANFTWVGFNNDNLYIYGQTSGIGLRSTAFFRDTSAWYHIVVAFDTTQSTASNRAKAYVNGVQVTAWGVQEDYGTQNNDIDLYDTNTSHYLGWSDAQSQSGYYAEFYLIDGQQLAPTEFGETDSDSGIWKPKAYGGTFGNQGYHLDFKDSSALGADVSGNGNNFTALYNITAADQATDTPTNNFSNLEVGRNPAATFITFTEGNTKLTYAGSTTAYDSDGSGISNFRVNTSGKWYMEFSFAGDGDRAVVGVVSDQGANHGADTDYTRYIMYRGNDGHVIYNTNGTDVNVSGAGPTYDSPDIIGIVLDCDNERVSFSKNGSWIDGSGSSASNSSPTYYVDWTGHDFLTNSTGNGNCVFVCTNYVNSGTPVIEANFGGYTVNSISSGNTDANGYGNFEYEPPSGYYALCTKNLAEYG